MTELSNQLGNTMNKAKRPRRIGLLKALYVSMFASMSLLSGCQKYELDRQMEALCKKDGGVRVYETVELPPEMFDQGGGPFPGWRKRKLDDRLSPDYAYERTDTILKDGDPLKGQGLLRRFQVRIIRRADMKIMGESVNYGRSGGDFIVIDHFTSKVCPAKQGSNDVIHQVFINKGK